ncbi:MAG TPA: ABC transporter substrate-binding protein [Thermomicrobiales bacterium]|nr:ABC transporter substrate-binding protein [Thermomicrobiales bacterium]
MPVEQSEPKTDHPTGVPAVSRRAVVRGAAGAWLGAYALFTTGSARAQTPVATPSADQAVETVPGITLPESITLAATEPASGTPARGGALRLVRPGRSLENFNPSAFHQDPQIPFSYLEPLVRPDPVTMRPAPWLAERWEWRDRGLELNFVLRDGVVWHDGATLTAADAAFSFEVYGSDTNSIVSELFSLVENVEVVSDRELRVRFTARDPNWLFNVATLPIVSRKQYGEYWEGLPAPGRTLSGFDWSRDKPVGTGPWQLSEWEASHAAFTRFDRYWGRGPWLDQLEIAVIDGPRARLEAWQNGRSEVTWPVRVPQLSELREVTGTLYPVPAASVMFAAFNFANPNQPDGSLWSDLRVRVAASQAINRERYAQDVFAGFTRWRAAGTIAQPWAHDDELTTPAFSQEAASVLLTESGWIDYDGDGVREDVNGRQLRPIAIVREDSRPELAAVMARVARDLASIGIIVSIEVLPPDVFDERWITRRDYDLIAYAYDQLPGFTDFDLYGSTWDIRTNPAGWNPGGYANPEADAAIDAFLGAVSVERQAVALRRLQRAVDEDLFGLWLGFPDDLVLVAPGIEGFEPNMAWQTARTWDLWRDPENA